MVWAPPSLLRMAPEAPNIILTIMAAVHMLRISPEKLIFSSLIPILKVLILAGIGLVMALPSVGVLNETARHAMSKLVFSIFLPAIIFVELGAAISPSNFIKWWFIPVNVILASVIGCTIGVIVARLTKCPPEFRRIAHVMVGIGNMGNMPLVLLSAVCSDADNPFGPTCAQDGTAYIGLGMWMAAIIMWSWVYNYVAPPMLWLPNYTPKPPKTKRRPLRIDLPPTSPTMGMVASSSGAFAPDDDEEEEEHPLTPLLRHPSLELARQASATVVEQSTRLAEWFTWLAKVLHIYDILRPPVLAACLAMFVGLIAPLRHALFDASGPLRPLSDVLTILGGAMIPGILLVLGGNLVNGPGSSELNFATTVALVSVRLLVMPAVGLCVVLTADHLGWLPPNDKMFRFVLMLQHAMPSSIQIGTACSLRGFGEKEVSAILFWEHITAVLTMTAYLLVFMSVLFGGSS